MKISIIVAMASNRTIGINGQMPWHLSADLKYFRKITTGSAIIMGRKTFESIGRPLPNRCNIIISRNPDYQQPNCHCFTDLDSALRYCADAQEVFVIGGAEIYNSTLPKANFLYITEIKKDFSGDTFFPAIVPEQWREIDRQDVDHDQQVNFRYSFVKLERVKL